MEIINKNDIEIGDEQAEEFAINIFQDISTYLDEHFGDFIGWYIDKLTCSELTTDEYEYELCKYNKLGSEKIIWK